MSVSLVRATGVMMPFSSRVLAGGVVGIVANKLVERYRKPAILLNQSENGILRGSARSVEGLHITEAIIAKRAIDSRRIATRRGRGGKSRRVDWEWDDENLWSLPSVYRCDSA